MNNIRLLIINFRQLIWRIGDGIVGESKKYVNQMGETVENLSKESQSRLQKQARVLYLTYMQPDSTLPLGIKMLPEIKTCIQRFLSQDYQPDDYLSVLRYRKQVYEHLESLFFSFQHSESYFNLIRDYQSKKLDLVSPLKIDIHLDSSILMTNLWTHLVSFSIFFVDFR